MYPYYYPSYYNPSKQAAQMPGMGPMGPTGSMPGMGGMPPTGGMPDMTDMTGGQGMGDMLPPVPGTTAGLPTESVPPVPPTIQPPPVDFTQQPGPPVTTDIGYTQAYLRTHIGQRVKIEFLIGTNSLTDRIGTLVDVGISYVIIRLVESDDLLLGDIYAIKFVTFYK